MADLVGDFAHANWHILFSKLQKIEVLIDMRRKFPSEMEASHFFQN